MPAWQQEHMQHAPPTKTEYDYLSGWIKKKKSHTQKKPHPNMVSPRDIAGERKRKRKMNGLVLVRETVAIVEAT